ncbi:MAG: hypothetical protein R3E08_10195 [Thiotrichaceae bacterium]
MPISNLSSKGDTVHIVHYYQHLELAHPTGNQDHATMPLPTTPVAFLRLKSVELGAAVLVARTPTSVKT